jgi:hypothetical protein
MTKQQKLETAEEFVKRVVTQTFNQKIDADTLRSAAEKLARVVDIEQVKEPA